MKPQTRLDELYSKRLSGVYMGDCIGSGVQGLGSKLLRGAYMGDHIGEFYLGLLVGILGV